MSQLLTPAHRYQRVDVVEGRLVARCTCGWRSAPAASAAAAGSHLDRHVLAMAERAFAARQLQDDPLQLECELLLEAAHDAVRAARGPLLSHPVGPSVLSQLDVALGALSEAAARLVP